MCKGKSIYLFFSFLYLLLLNIRMETNDHSNIKFLVHSNIRNEIFFIKK